MTVLNKDELIAGGFSSAASATRSITSSPVIAVIGDSITKPDYTNSDQIGASGAPWAGSPSTSWKKQSTGYMSWALALCGQRVELPVQNIWSFPGMTSSTILANISAFMAQCSPLPGTVVVECGTNDAVTDVSYATLTANWAAIASAIMNRGSRVLFMPILPRNATEMTQARADVAVAANIWLLEAARRSNGWITVANNHISTWALNTSTLYEAITGVQYDSPATHPNTLGAYYIGKAVALVLSQQYPPIDLLPNNALTWGASAPNGNRVTDCMFTSSTAATGTGISGVRPASWPLSSSAQVGLTVVGSLVNSTIDGQPMFQMVIGGSYTITGQATPTTSVFARLQQTLSTGSKAALLAGETYEALHVVEIDSGNNCVQSPTLEYRWDTATNTNNDMAFSFASQGPLPSSEAIRMVLRTPPHTYTATPVSANEVSINLWAYLTSVTGVYAPTATIRMGRPVLRKVAS